MSEHYGFDDEMNEQQGNEDVTDEMNEHQNGAEIADEMTEEQGNYGYTYGREDTSMNEERRREAENTEAEAQEQYKSFVKKNRKERRYEKYGRSGKSGRYSGMMKKTASVAALALVFGLVAGGSFQAVGYAANAAEARAEAQTEAATETVASAVSQMSSTSTTAAETSAASTGSEMSVSDVAQKVLPSIVAINCTGTTTVNTMWGNSQQQYTSCGTGIIVGKNDTELLIATNNHVVEGSDTVSVSFADDAAADALIKGTDADNDLAVIAVQLSDITDDTMNAISIAEIGDSDSAEVGEQVVAIGNALGYGQSVTTGIISAKDRSVTTEDGTTNSLIQTDAAINPGNSGGALVNMEGQVIAINSAKYSDTEVEGMGYAIPISTASPILDELMERETRTEVSEDESSWLGIQGQDITESIASAYNMPEGIYVVGISDDSPAAESGMQTGDIITKFDGTSVSSITELQKQMTYYASGETVTVVVKRCENGEYTEKELTVTLGHQDQTTTDESQSSQSQTQNGSDGSSSDQNSAGSYYNNFFGGQGGTYGYSYPQSGYGTIQ